MPPKIQILQTAALTPLGDLNQLWQLWLAGNPIPPPAHNLTWQTLTTPIAKQISEPLTTSDRSTTGLILATTKANITAQTQWMRSSHNSPIGNQQSAINPHPPLPTLAAAAHQLALTANILGPTHTVSTACTSGLTALIDASISLLAGESSHMIALAADEITSFVTDGFTALHALSPTATCKPFDQSRDGLTLAPAAAAMLLTLAPSASPLPTITGLGLANDATHMTAPDPAANGLITAIHQALTMAKLHPHQIDVLLAHATGTKYNDAMEAVAIQKIFLTHSHKTPAVTALKSFLGHTLGASGLLELTLACKILEHQTIPKILNLTTPEFPPIDFVTTPRKTKIRHLLKTASGFGGFNAAIILSLPV